MVKMLFKWELLEMDIMVAINILSTCNMWRCDNIWVSVSQTVMWELMVMLCWVSDVLM